MIHTLWRETSSFTSLKAGTLDSMVTWGPVVTIMPLLSFALPCVVDPSVYIVASKLNQSIFSNVCIATTWSDAVSPVFCPINSKV